MNVKLNKYTLIEVCGNEDIKSSENKDKFGYAKMWHDKVWVFSLDREMSHYFKITIYKIKKIVYN